jgi:hypothetical protein
MCCARSCFHQMDSFHQYSKQTLYFYSLLLKIKFFPPSSICRVSNLLIIVPMPLRMPGHEFCIPRVGEHTFQMIDHWKIPHHQGRNFPNRHVLCIKISSVINTLWTDSSLVLIFGIFLHSVGIHMIVTSLVLTHTTCQTLRVELILFAYKIYWLGHVCILSTPMDSEHVSFFTL